MTFEPTHITTNAIGDIPARTPIRVANIASFPHFADLLGYLGDQPYISYTTDRNGHLFTDERGPGYSSNSVFPGDYVITDGNKFVASSNDTGWERIPEDSAETMVTLRFRMSNGDEYSAGPLALGSPEAEDLIEGAGNLASLSNLWFNLTDNSKVVLNPTHVSSVEVIHNV